MQRVDAYPHAAVLRVASPMMAGAAWQSPGRGRDRPLFKKARRTAERGWRPDPQWSLPVSPATVRTAVVLGCAAFWALVAYAIYSVL